MLGAAPPPPFMAGSPLGGPGAGPPSLRGRSRASSEGQRCGRTGGGGGERRRVTWRDAKRQPQRRGATAAAVRHTSAHGSAEGRGGSEGGDQSPRRAGATLTNRGGGNRPPAAMPHGKCSPRRPALAAMCPQAGSNAAASRWVEPRCSREREGTRSRPGRDARAAQAEGKRGNKFKTKKSL